MFLTCAVAAAQERAKPGPLGQAAEKVLAAFKAEDKKTIASLAAKDTPDPWIVADELCRRGGHDAAEAFAKAAPRKDVEKLPAYVASRRGKPANTIARKALAKANRALRARDWQAALATLEAVDATVADLVSVRILYGRGFAAYRARRLERSAKAFLAAATAAERLGWFAKASSALHSAGLIAYYRSDWRFALAAWKRRLALEESRANRTGVAAALVNIGSIHKALGSYAKALECQERALALMKALGDRAGEAAALSSFGTIHSMLGSLAKALEYQERALEEREALYDRAGRG